MPGNRKAAEATCFKWIDKLDPSGKNKALYAAKFSKMDDAEFDQLITDLISGKQRLCIVVPNFSDVKLDVGRNLKLLEELGHSPFERLWMPAQGGVPRYLTPIPYLVITLPVRRQAQLLTKKISIPEDSNCVDDLTGQPTGRSKGSKISYPEFQVIASMGLDSVLLELEKYRGGDEGGFNAMRTELLRTGEVELNQIAPQATGVKSKDALSALLNGMMLENTL